LTGKPLLVLAALLAIALPVACLRYWAKSTKRYRGRTGVRLSLFMSSQLATVFVVGLVLNDYGQFYSSWSDLFQTNSSTPLAGTAGHYGAPDTGVRAKINPTALDGGAPAIPPESAGWDTVWGDRAEWPTKGAVVNTTVTGPASNLTQQALVYLPPRYFHTGPFARRMPIVEVLTGFPGTPMNLVTRMDYPDMLATAISGGKTQDMVLVMMRPAPAFPWDTECSDVPHGPQTLQFFTRDVPDTMAAKFGLQPTGLAAMGDSTGGYCAAKISMFDPVRFPTSVVLSGYFRPSTDMTTRGIFDGNPTFRDQNDLTWRLKHLPAPKVSMLVSTARDENGPDGYLTALRWLHSIRPPMSADELLLDSGGHNFRTWRREIPFALQWLSDHLAAPT